MSAQFDESARQRELDTYRAVDSLPEAAYEDVVRLASMLCGTPIALVSLIDRDRQWFKARVGFELAQTRRDDAFCNHAIRAPQELMEVPDAKADARFVDNPFLKGDAAIRFYAGMPLVTPSGAAIGTVCVLDRQPRTLSDEQRAGLASLARLTMNLLEASHRERDLERAALLAAQPVAQANPSPQAAPSNAIRRTLAIFEVQDIAAAATRIGERAVERALQRLEETLNGVLPAGAGDSVSRVSGSAEIIALLHGADGAVSLQKLRDCLPAFERETTLQVTSAHADSHSANESLGALFLRADEALTREKNARRAAH